MRRLAKRHSIYILWGTFPVTDDGRDEIFNEAFFFGPSGDYGVQGKIH